MFTLLRSSVFNRWFCYLLTSISHSGFSKLPILFMQIYIIEDPQLQQIFFRDASSPPSTTTNGCRYVVAWPSTDLEILKPPMVILDGVTSAMNLGQLLGCRFFGRVQPKQRGESAVFVVRWSLDWKVIVFHKFRKKRRGLSQGVMRSWAKRKVLVDMCFCLFFFGGVYYSINSPRLLRTARCLGVESFVAGPKYMQTWVRLTVAYIPVKSNYMQTWVWTVLKFMDTTICAKAFLNYFLEIPKKCQRLWSHRWVFDLQCQPIFPGRFGCHLVCLQWPPGGRLRRPGLLQQRAPRAPHADEPGKNVAAAVPGASGADAVCSGRVLHQSPGGGRGSFGGGILGGKAWQKLHAINCIFATQFEVGEYCG